MALASLVLAMGNSTSSLSGLESNAGVQRMVSPEALAPMHPFWNGMLSFKVKTPRSK